MEIKSGWRKENDYCYIRQHTNGVISVRPCNGGWKVGIRRDRLQASFPSAESAMHEMDLIFDALEKARKRV